MPLISYSSNFSISSDLSISVDEIRKTYLHGISLKNRSGQEIQDWVIEDLIKLATEDLENSLSIKLCIQLYNENISLFGDDIASASLIRFSLPVVCVKSIKAKYGQFEMFELNNESITFKKSSDSMNVSRNVHIVPTGNFYLTHNAIQVGFYRSGNLPNYWDVTYVTGWKNPPRVLVDVIAKMVCINILPIASDAYLPYPGATSQSISLDGLSQSVSTTNSASSGLFGARIKQYIDELTQTYPRLRDRFLGVNFTTL